MRGIKKPKARSYRVIKGISRCGKCNKDRLECRRIVMDDGSIVIACPDCKISKKITGKKIKKPKITTISSAFETNRRKH